MRESDIDAHLKRAFQELADEALPDRFSDLLAKLRAGETGGRDAPAGGAGGGLNGASRDLRADAAGTRDDADGADPVAEARTAGARAFAHEAPGAQGHAPFDEAAKPLAVDAAGARQRK